MLGAVYVAAHVPVEVSPPAEIRQRPGHAIGLPGANDGHDLCILASVPSTCMSRSSSPASPSMGVPTRNSAKISRSSTPSSPK